MSGEFAWKNIIKKQNLLMEGVSKKKSKKKKIGEIDGEETKE